MSKLNDLECAHHRTRLNLDEALSILYTSVPQTEHTIKVAKLLVGAKVANGNAVFASMYWPTKNKKYLAETDDTKNKES